MNKKEAYVPPDVWTWDKENGGPFSHLNRPESGATHQKLLPVGKHPLQLYSQGTPNGIKVTIMLEELQELSLEQAEYDAHLIDISTGDQFSSGFVEINPNSKIPVLLDRSGDELVSVFESGSILLYLAEKFGSFLPRNLKDRTSCLSWLFWQVGSAPYLGGGFGHFYFYAPTKIEYAINRFAMETKRQLDLLNKHFANYEYVVGEEYSIADMSIWPWYGGLVRGELYGAADFLDVSSYHHLGRWVETVGARPAVKRGRMVNRVKGPLEEQLRERHDAADFYTRTEDKIQSSGKKS
ncbi:glutathione-dependent disulfide-bond oxidoreductase [Hyphomonas polymorpha]|uniref:glutathione-dependent disulfide-bond oxidoreductase n=1 Tax=Hyphomonas polymorpha TaxID=74319 RepID=UPI003BB08F4C